MYAIPKRNYGGSILSGGLSMAGTGAQIGTTIAPGMGTAIGAGIGLVAGGLSGYLGQKSREEEEKRVQDEVDKLKLENKEMLSRQIINNYPVRGFSGASYYAKYGAKIPKYANGGAMGGAMVPIANNASRVVGDSHEQDSNQDGMTGVTITNPNGMPKAEVEGGEVVVEETVEDMVFSKRLSLPDGTSFADAAHKLAKSPQYTKYKKDAKKAEELIASNDVHRIASAKHIAENNPNPMEMLFQMQEQVKQMTGAMNPDEQQMQGQEQSAVPMGMYGTKIPKYAYGNNDSDPERNPQNSALPGTYYLLEELNKVDSNTYSDPKFANFNREQKAANVAGLNFSRDKKRFPYIKGNSATDALNSIKEPTPGLQGDKSKEIGIPYAKSNNDAPILTPPVSFAEGRPVAGFDGTNYDGLSGVGKKREPINIDKIDPIKPKEIPTKDFSAPDTLVAPPDAIPNLSGKSANYADLYKPGMHMVSRLVDNIYNAGATANTPKIPTPELTPIVPMTGKVNVSDGLNRNEAALRGANRSIERSGGSGSTQYARKADALAKTLEANNTLRANADRQEGANIRGILNTSQQVAGANNETINQFKFANMQRADELIARNSANVADATQDMNTQNLDMSRYNLDKQTIETIALKYKNSGVWDRNAPLWLKEMIDAGTISIGE